MFESKNKLAICCLFNPELHGYDTNSTSNILSHYLIYIIVDIEDFYNNLYKQELNRCKMEYKNWIINKRTNHIDIIHPIINNYKAIISKSNNYKINIIEDEILSGEEHVAYIKTFWLKIIQRKWKKVYQERKEILKIRKTFRALREKEMTGKWPKGARTWPKFSLDLKI